MKICNGCKRPNDERLAYCASCGAALQVSQTATEAGLCPNGHVLDPSWQHCPYCASSEQRGGGRTPTVVDAGVGGPQPVSFSAPYPVAPPAEPLPGTRRKTVFAPPPAPGADTGSRPVAAAADRRIVGVLVTHSWYPDGRIFPVREGRNIIGRSTDCDICVPEDPTLSEKNSHITYRASFVVGDLVSLGGTDLDGQPIETQFAPLPDRAKLRTGSTAWLFVSLL